MKLVFTKSNLLSAINIVLKAVPGKTTMPILECILIDATNDGITFTANDTELGIETKVTGDVIEKGMIAIDAKFFSEIIRKLPDSEITITSDSMYNVEINCEKSKFHIQGKSGEDFSFIPNIERDKVIYLSQFTLRDIIKQTIFCTADNESNKLMTGELMEVKNNKLRLVALDGHRIAIRKVELKESFDNVRVVIPGKTLSEISKILTGGVEDEVKIFFTNNHVLFEFDQTIVVSRLIEGEYFKIDQMLSNDYATKVSVNKSEFLNCIDRASLLIREGDKKPIIVGINDGVMELKIKSMAGSMNESLFVEKEGKDILIGFNPKFFMDALRAIDDETITFYTVNPKAPCFIRNEEESYIYLILPVNFVN
ncbi:MAG: DNA polymerase III subunit beta [Lachnospiraceae bacterium]|nr:DNA polymerase III subunit beta [Lachnospiraceae bacterium]